MSAMYCKTCGQDSAELLRQVSELRARVRAARRALLNPTLGLSWVLRALDLRRPLPAKPRAKVRKGARK